MSWQAFPLSVCRQKYIEEINVKMTASQTPKSDGKGFEPCRAGAVPATPDYKFLRKMGKIRGLTV